MAFRFNQQATAIAEAYNIENIRLLGVAINHVYFAYTTFHDEQSGITHKDLAGIDNLNRHIKAASREWQNLSEDAQFYVAMALDVLLAPDVGAATGYEEARADSIVNNETLLTNHLEFLEEATSGINPFGSEIKVIRKAKNLKLKRSIQILIRYWNSLPSRRATFGYDMSEFQWFTMEVFKVIAPDVDSETINNVIRIELKVRRNSSS